MHANRLLFGYAGLSRASFLVLPIALAVTLIFAPPTSAAPVPISASKLKVERGKVFFYIQSYFTKARVKELRGSGKRVSGSIDMTARDIRVDLDVRDFSTRNRGRDKDMHEDVLNSSRHKFARFRGRILNYDAATGKVKATGTLTVHGKPRRLDLTGRVRKTKKGWRLRTVFSLSLKAHGMKAPRNLFVLRVDDKVRVKLFLYLESAD